MLCGVVALSNWAWIWISCSRRLLFATPVPLFELPELVEEVALLEDGGVVIDTLEPSA
jgi:hypothetical protein